MYRTTIDFHNRITRGEVPVPYCVITTHLGPRVYSRKEMGSAFDPDAYYADGSHLADGSITAGSSIEVVEKSARVLSFGGFERAIQPKKEALLLAYFKKAMQHVSVTLNDADRHLAKILGKEPFLSRAFEIKCGFDDLLTYHHLKLFEGVVSDIRVGNGRMVVTAEET